MELVDRYVNEVGRHLPRRGRADIQEEIRSLIEDTLDGFAQKQGREVDQEMVVAVLQEFGKPEAVAASYRSGKQYLFGPELYPIFKLVLTVVFSVISGLYLVGVVVALTRASSFLDTLWNIASSTLPEYFTSITSILGIIVIVFFILERVLTPEQLADEEEEWDPTKLEKIDEPNRVSRSEEIIGIVFVTILLVLFNFFPHRVGVYFFGENQGFISILVDGYQTLMPWINLWWLSSLVVKVINLRRGHWTTWTRLAEIGVNLIGIYLMYQIFSGAPFLGINLEWSSGSVDWAITLLDNLDSVARLATRLGLGIIIIVTVFETIAQIYRLITNRPEQKWEVPQSS